jgi:hypothetical protein
MNRRALNSYLGTEEQYFWWFSAGWLARPEGLEPPAYWFEANRSIQLSYGRG